MAKNALQALDDLDWLGEDNLLFISDEADDRAELGRGNGLGPATNTAVAVFGLEVAAAAPAGAPTEPDLPESVPDGAGPFLSFDVGGTTAIDPQILSGKPKDGPGSGGGGGDGGGRNKPKDDPDSDPTVVSEYTSGGNAKKSFNIEIHFDGDGWTVELQQYLINVADYLSTIITGDLIDVVVPGSGKSGKFDDIRIDASLFEDGDSGGLLGWGGYSGFRSATYDSLPYYGAVGFNLYYQDGTSGDSNPVDLTPNMWQAVVFQEMLHALGFGFWEALGLVTDVSLDPDPVDLRFDGTNANEAYLYDPALGNARLADSNEATGVPIESDGELGDGTYGGHWDEGIFGNEVMTGYINDTNFLSIVTVAALEDMGYDTIYDTGVTTASLADELVAENLGALVFESDFIA